MKLSSLFPSSMILLDLKANDRSSVLKELSQCISSQETDLKAEELYRVFLEREKLGSTGIGAGVAIPHGKLAQVKKMLACFGRSNDGVDFGAQDGEKSHLFFALIAPENAAGLHLKVLAKISRLLKSKDLREQLMQAGDTEQVIKLLSQEDD